MRKPAFCICENKHAEADQRLCFHYKDSNIPLLPKSETSCLQPSSVVVQPSLYVMDLFGNHEERFSSNAAQLRGSSNKF